MFRLPSARVGANDPIGMVLAEVRALRSVTHVELAAASGISQATISRMERGIPQNIETLRAICTALGVPLAGIVAAAHEVQPHIEAARDAHTATVLRIQTAANRLLEAP